MRALADLSSDLARALRALVRRPGFAAMAVASLAVAIGVNATIFGLVDAVLLRPLPGVRSAPLVSVFTSESDGNGFGVCSYPAAQDLAARRDLFTHVGAASPTPLQVTQEGSRQTALGLLVSGDWFAALGARAERGRTLTLADDRAPGESPVVVLSHGYWQRRLASDPAIVGRTLRLNGHEWTVVGVMPAAFRGVFMGLTPDLYVPAQMEAWAAPGRNDTRNRGGRSFSVTAQLAGGVRLSRAQHELDALAAQLGREYPRSDSGRAFLVTREEDSRPFPQARPMVVAFLSLLQGVTLLVLLIACANLAGLLLARGVERRRELGVRLALGATRAQLVRMLVSESLLIGLLGGAGGLLLAHAGTAWLVGFQPPLPVPVTLDLRPDARVAAFALLLGLAASVVFSLVPALRSTTPRVSQAMRDEPGFRRSRLRSALLVTQVALSMLLLAGAGLFLRALTRARALDPGFDARHVTTASFDPSLSGYDLPRTRAFYRDLLAALRARPGVESAAIAEHVPLGLDASAAGMWLPGRTGADAERPLDMPVNAVSEGYFETLRIPIVRGRALRTAQPVGEVVVNHAFAERFWPGRDPLGERVSLDGPTGPWRTVVGVAANSSVHTIGEPPRAFLYVAADHDGEDAATLFVRSRPGSEAATAATVRDWVNRFAPALAPAETRTLESQLGVSLLPGRLAGTVLLFAGATALLLACLGLYAVVAFGVSRRTREIGVRVALGAQPHDVLRLVMGDGARLLMVGLGLGLALAVAAGQLLRSLLYGLSPADPLAYLIVTALLAASALLACWLPARRATALDPAVALRQD